MSSSKDLSTSYQWLLDRGIKPDVLDEAGVSVQKDRIVIPILDINGKPIFNKYRRLPNKTEGPKYWYDKGQQAHLYNIAILKQTTQVIICEGELDALLLLSKGYAAVCSTGGAGTFKDEWVPYFSDKVAYVLYDNDEAGLTGAQKVISKLGEAKLAVLPDGDWNDVTDYFQSHDGQDFSDVLDQAATISSWQPDEEPKTKAQLKAAERKYKLQLIALLDEERAINQGREDRIEFNYLRSHYNNQIAKLRRLRNKDQEAAYKGEIEKAKAVPIESLYDGELKYKGNLATGLCSFHNENTPSFTIYLDDNTFHCYGCQAGRDSIDFVMHRDNVDFKTAVATLND